MKLSEGEKLILAMLCDIHEGLNLKRTVDLDQVRSAIRDRQEQMPQIARADDGDRVAAEVGDILHMWSAIERGYKHLTVDEKREVEAGAGPLGRGVRFSGFCAEIESRHREMARHLIEESGKFDRFQGRNLTAHMPSLEGYRRMMRVFAPMCPPGSDARLGVQQIIVLANAEKYAG